jgi:hypothetical protein
MATVNMTHVNAMVALAKANGFTVTSTTGGKHNSGSLHSKGLAIDVRTRDKSSKQVEAFILEMENNGYKVRDERIKPPLQKVWSGPHLHIEVIPKKKL